MEAMEASYHAQQHPEDEEEEERIVTYNPWEHTIRPQTQKYTRKVFIDNKDRPNGSSPFDFKISLTENSVGPYKHVI
jgi:hypothetical protein